MKTFLIGFSFLFSSFLSALDFPNVQSPDDLTSLFPRTTEEMLQRKITVSSNFNQVISSLKSLPEDSLSFENFVSPLNEALAYILMFKSQNEALMNIEPIDELRKEAQISLVYYEELYSNFFSDETSVYQRLKALYEKEQNQLSKDQKYLMTYLLREFELCGHSLSSEKREEIKRLKSEITKIEQQFATNIQEDQSQLVVETNALKGLNEQILSRFEKTSENQYTLRCDYPSYFSVMTTCENSKTRRDFLNLFRQRAYPNNEQVLSLLIQKRDEYAKALHYESYNHLALSKEMAKHPREVSTFLNELYQLSSKKSELEFKKQTQNLPSGIKLSKHGKIFPWDSSYILTQYKKKHFDLDQEKIAEYFPLEQTFKGLLSIYETFFNIDICEVKAPKLWHEDLQTLQISEKDGTLIGYVILDLFPRPNKYNHACCVPGVAWNYQTPSGSLPGVDVIIANFTKPSSQTPSLLKHREVQTLFHEFGHALHDLFSKHTYPLMSTIATPMINYDYVELPSQLLENWLWEPDMLASISSHYQTHEPLPAQDIEKLIESKNIASGQFVDYQVYLSFLALNYFSKGAHKDVKQIAKELKKHLDPYHEPMEQDYSFLSFGHLTEYGPRYYGYLWSNVFACDIFSEIKKEGLLNPKVGERYRKMILNPGASKDPNELIVNFLGRPPQISAFIENLGL